MRETQARSLSPENPPKKERATRSSTLGWKFPGMEQRGRYSPRGRRVGHDRATSLPQQRPGDAAARLKGGPESRHASVWVSSALAFRSAENLLITSQVFLKPSEFDQTTATVQQKKSSASRPRGLDVPAGVSRRGRWVQSPRGLPQGAPLLCTDVNNLYCEHPPLCSRRLMRGSVQPGASLPKNRCPPCPAQRGPSQGAQGWADEWTPPAEVVCGVTCPPWAIFH